MTPVCAHCGQPATNVTAAHLRRSLKRGHRIFCGRECAAAGKKRPVADRFWARVDKNAQGGCWIWRGKPKQDGYGQFWYGGRPQYAHRVALDLLGIVIPDGWDADHTCRNRLCVSPYHLRAATERQNALENNDSPHAKNARKTHCTPGNHPFAGDNLHWQIVRGRLRRFCLACQRKRRPGCPWQPNTPETAYIPKPRKKGGL